jgi:hypothetical protein
MFFGEEERKRDKFKRPDFIVPFHAKSVKIKMYHRKRNTAIIFSEVSGIYSPLNIQTVTAHYSPPGLGRPILPGERAAQKNRPVAGPVCWYCYCAAMEPAYSNQYVAAW